MWLELLRHTVSVQAYSTTSSWHFLLLTPCTPAVTGWDHCWVPTQLTQVGLYRSLGDVTTLPRHGKLFQTRKFRRFGFSLCVVAERYILQQKCLKKWTRSALLTRRYNFQIPTPIVNAAIDFVTDRQTYGQTDRRQYHANSRSYCVQQYDRLKIPSVKYNSVVLNTVQ